MSKVNIEDLMLKVIDNENKRIKYNVGGNPESKEIDIDVEDLRTKIFNYLEEKGMVYSDERINELAETVCDKVTEFESRKFTFEDTIEIENK